jgi:acyl-homoserine-lactone acylase
VNLRRPSILRNARLPSLLIALLYAMAASVGAAPPAPTHASQPHAASVPVPPAARRVTIYRDDWGVPHVYAATEADAFFGVGYALAQDDLESILKAFLAMQGGLARAFGPEFVDRDFEMLQWRILAEGRNGFAALPPNLQLATRRYLAGIQAYMEQHPEKVPGWAPHLDPALPVAYGHMLSKMISLLLPGNGWSDCAAAGVKMPTFPQLLASVSPEAAQSGMLASNEWVLMPQRTSVGSPYLWADSHSNFDSARDEVRIHAGALHASGVVPAGTFLPLIGHSNGVAWAFTMGAPDVSDCYRVSKGTRPVIREEFSVSSRNGSSERRTFEYVQLNGVLAPVIARDEAYIYAIATPYVDGSGYTRQVYAMNRAAHLGQFRRALSIFGLFPQNIMAADTRGDSLYVHFGRVPVRSRGIDTTRPLAAEDRRTTWAGTHALRDLVSLANPRDGYMQNNNIAPDRMTTSPSIDPASYASYLFNDVPGRTNERAMRSLALLSQTRTTSPAEFERIGLDEVWLHTPEWQKALRSALLQLPEYESQHPGKGDELVQRLLSFDGRAVADSIPALNYFYWRYSLGSDESAPDRVDALAEAVEKGQMLSVEQQRLLLTAVDASIQLMMRHHNTIDKPYGAVFRIGRSDRSFPLGGGSLFTGTRGERTLRSMGCFYEMLADGAFLDANGECLALGGQRHPILTVLSKPVQSFSAVPYGQSADPSSRHHLDQAEHLASAARLKPAYFDPPSLSGHIASTITLDVRELR